MKKLFQNTSVFICTLIMIFNMNFIPAYAAETASVSISSGTVTTGNTVTVSVNISSNTDMLLISLWLSYDTNVLEYVSGASGGGGGSLQLKVGDGGTEVYRNATYNLTFKALAAGTSNISINKSHAECFIAGGTDNMSINAGSGSVTVNNPVNVVLSSNNNLSGLSITSNTGKAVTLSPGFSPDITSYTANVESDCTSLVVNANPQDSTAKVSNVAGKAMDPGLNTTTITVTAQNGSTKTYTIKTTREATNNATSANNATVSDGAQQQATTAVYPTTTVNGSQYNIISDFTSHPLPSGYTEVQFDFNGQKVSAGKGENGLTIMYLEKVNGNGAGGFYVYDTVTKTFSPLSTVIEPVTSFTILPITSTMELPSGYVKSTLTINGNEVDVLIPDGPNVKYCLFYGVDNAGNASWYCYDYQQQTVQKYYGAGLTNVAASSLNSSEDNSGSRIWKLVSGGVAIICIILLVSLVTLLIKMRIKRSANNSYEEPDIFDSIIRTENKENNQEDLEDENYLESDEDILESLPEDDILEGLSEDGDILESLPEDDILENVPLDDSDNSLDIQEVAITNENDADVKNSEINNSDENKQIANQVYKNHDGDVFKDLEIGTKDDEVEEYIVDLSDIEDDFEFLDIEDIDEKNS